MKPSILITGGSGLLALNWALAIRDRFSVILGIHDREVSLAGVSAQRIDLESVDNLQKLLDSVRPQVVVHAAGLTSVEKCEKEPDLARHINVDLAANVARACAKHGIALVHISTDHLFSGETSLVDETQRVEPLNVYGRTKAEAENRVMDKHSDTVVARTNFYGWGPSYRQSFSDVILNALQTGKQLTLFKDVFYTPIIIDQLVIATHQLIDRGERGIFHIVGDERVSKYEFGLMTAERFGLDTGMIKPSTIHERTDLVRRPHDMSLSNDKVCKILGHQLGGVAAHLDRLYLQKDKSLASELRTVN